LRTGTGGPRLDEADLIRGARSGDPVAWEGLVRLHQEAVYRYACWLVGDHDEAEDVAQETFLRLMRTFDRFDSSRPLRPWLIRIARNLARNRWRSARRALAALERFRVDRLLAGTSADASAEPALDPRGTAWRAALARLAEADRQVVILRYLLDLSVEETGQALGLPIGTVKSRASRARARLRRLAEEGDPALREALEP
jgi:RNA polymerase sigma-70 factor (ECF subfamily)